MEGGTTGLPCPKETGAYCAWKIQALDVHSYQGVTPVYVREEAQPHVASFDGGERKSNAKTALPGHNHNTAQYLSHTHCP